MVNMFYLLIALPLVLANKYEKPYYKPNPLVIIRTGVLASPYYAKSFYQAPFIPALRNSYYAKSYYENPIIPECRYLRCPYGRQCSCENPSPATCDNPDPKPCPRYKCNLGCYVICKKGEVLTHNGSLATCIPKELCPGHDKCKNVQCPLGLTCACQNPCPATCDNPNPDPCPTLECNLGCYVICKKGEVLRHNGTGAGCIKKAHCPKKHDRCYENEEYYKCKQCRGTCREPKPDCTLEVFGKYAGCDCKMGFVRDEKTDKCVDADEPSCESQRITQCYPEEVLAQCASAQCEEQRCDNSSLVCAQYCVEPPLGFCVCKKGLFRDPETGECVDPQSESCKKQQCKNDEQFYPCCTAKCQPTCETPNPVCPKECITPGNCDCKEGFVRNTENNTCVDPNETRCQQIRVAYLKKNKT